MTADYVIEFWSTDKSKIVPLKILKPLTKSSVLSDGNICPIKENHWHIKHSDKLNDNGSLQDEIFVLI